MIFFNIPKVSINPLIAFVEATERRKSSIVKEQKKPSIIKVAPYATARTAMKRYLKDGFDEECIYNAIDNLQSQQPNSKWALNNAVNSIEALRHFIEMNFPQRVGKIHCSFSKAAKKECMLEGVVITVAPDLILRWEDNGKRYIGAIKFRISKNELSFSAGRHAASLISYYLRQTIAESDEIVDNSHCLFVDVMDDVIYPAPMDITHSLDVISNACYEYSTIWNVA